MSRSHRKTPICSWTCFGFAHGEQWWKRKAWRKVRMAVKRRLSADDMQAFLGKPEMFSYYEWTELDPYYHSWLIHGGIANEPEVVLPTLRELSEVWCWPKDGKVHYWGVNDPDRLRRFMAK